MKWIRLWPALIATLCAVATPASAQTSTVSGNGISASEAETPPLAASPAEATARRALVTRFGCPAPMPTIARSFTTTTAFDFTCFTQRQAYRRSRISSAVGSLDVSTRISGGSGSTWSNSCTSMPPAMP